MESQVVAPCRIDFGSEVDDKERQSLPVYLRIKPQQDEEMSIKLINSTTVETNHAFRANKKATFTHVFSGTANQQEVFNGTTAQLIQKFLDGANVMTFAYGVTSSGKTYTIMGSHADPGIIPRALQIIFGFCKAKIENSSPIYKPSMFDEAQEISFDDISQLEAFKSVLMSKVKGSYGGFDQYSFANNAAPDLRCNSLHQLESSLLANMSCSVWISIYEIHNEVITDLFQIDSKAKRKALNIGQDNKGRTFVKDLTQLPVKSASEAYGLLRFARQNLAKATTKLNDSSSRSHMVFSIKMVHWSGPVTEPIVNQFIISDLAGSERQAKTGTTGVTLKQAGAINNSLLVLGRCLEALRKKDKGISAPFRDSKLTRILNPFFTLGGYVSLIICINPHMHLQDETMDTIRFSAIASEIVQDPIRPLERLRQLRRLTQGCIENSPIKMVDDTEVQHWQDAVNGATVHNGVAFLEVKASYFNDMARDILRAEKLLDANEAEIQSLKERLRQAEASKENIKLMYQDKMKQQREKFTAQRAELEEMHRDVEKSLLEEFEEDIRTYKEKYLKYRDGYAKMTDYLKDKLWPEVHLFRERFGYLPEFPPKDGAADEELKPENTIKYWQDKLQDKENEFRAMKKSISKKSEQIVNLSKECEVYKTLLATAESETQRVLSETANRSFEMNELKEQLNSFALQQSEYESLVDEVSELKKALQTAAESTETLVAQHQVQINSLVEELDNIKAELREKDSELEDTCAALASSNARIEVFETAIAKLEKQNDSKSDGEAFCVAEKTKLEHKVIRLQGEIAKQHKQAVELQENIVTLQNEVDKLNDRESELKKREEQIALKIQDARRTRTAEANIARQEDELKRLQLALDEEREALAAKNALLLAHEAELDELRDKVATIEILGPQLEKVSEENRDFRDKVKELQYDKKRLETEVKQTRELQVEVEFLTRKLENQQKRILREYPQTEKTDRRRRSVSTSDIKRVPLTEKPRRRLRLGNEENSILDKTLDRAIRDISPTPTPYGTRSSRKRQPAQKNVTSVD